MILDDVIKDIDILIWSYIKRNNKIYGYLFDSLDDMHSECMLICIKRFGWFDETKGALSNYVYMCCRWVCSNKYKVWKRRNGKVLVNLDEPLNTNGDTFLDLCAANVIDPFEAEEKRDKQKEARYLLYKLKPFICPELLDHANGLTYRQIAAKEGISGARVGQKITKNKYLLKKMLERLKNGNFDKFTYQEAFRKIKLRLGCAERTAYRILNRYVDQGKVTLGVEDILNNLISKEDNYGKKGYLRKRNS